MSHISRLVRMLLLPVLRRIVSTGKRGFVDMLCVTKMSSTNLTKRETRAVVLRTVAMLANSMQVIM